MSGWGFVVSGLPCPMYTLRRDTERPDILITTPQRKANPKDKNRLKWGDAKRMALDATECSDTASVRKWLNVLGVGNRLNLRLTSAWVAVRVDLAHVIKARIAKMERAELGKIIQMSADKKSTLSKALSDVEIVHQAMLDAIAFSNWEYLRRALIDRASHKVAAWKMLSHHEQQLLKALIPQSIRLLKQALHTGAIAAFKEDSKGDIFLVWETADSQPELITGTSVATKYSLVLNR